MNLHKPAFAIILIVLGGCATTPKPDTQFLVKPFTVRLAEIPLPDRDAVRSMVAPDLPKDSTQVDQETSNVIEAAQSQALVDMTSAFRTLPDLHVDSSPLVLPRSLEGFPVTDRNQPLAPEVLAALRTTANADALLRFGVSDYGVTPKEWRNGVITFEVVSTLGIAAIAYAKPATRAIAGAYLLQESIEETVEATTGFWALDEVCRPVRVEAEMIDLKTGSRVWTDSATGFSGWRLSRLFRTVRAEERKAQLSAALRAAITKVVTDFRESAGR